MPMLRGKSPRSASNTSQRPSGDHDGIALNPCESVSFRTSLPSAFMV